MKGYKVFESDWKCRGFQYKVGKTYEIKEKPKICEVGFHFCTNLIDCFRYYKFDENLKIAEVEALGDIDTLTLDSSDKMCTNKIKILRELSLKNAIIETGEAIVYYNHMDSMGEFEDVVNDIASVGDKIIIGKPKILGIDRVVSREFCTVYTYKLKVNTLKSIIF